MLLRAALTSGLLFAIAEVLSAAPVTYSVSGTFTDGATISGSITFDNATGMLVSFDVVTQYNAGDGLGTTYDSATGTGSVQFPTNPPPVSGTYFAILLFDASQKNVLNLILSGPPSGFIGGPVVPSVPVQVGGSLLSAELSDNSFTRRTVSPAGIFLTPPPTTVPALSSSGILVATVLLAALGCFKTSRFAFRQ
jgi:hypothetical protein